MEFKLNQILESTILLEGRKDDVIKKYGEEHKSLIDRLSQSDPSGNNKYLGWMTKTALGLLNKEEDILSADSIVKLVTDFDKRLPGIKNKDLNSYKSVFDLKAVVDEANAKAEEKRISKQAKKVFEDDDVIVYAPLTKEASCKYGSGSRWCISAKGDNYFDQYSKHSNFYFILNKNMNATNNPRDYKYALQWRFDNGGRELTWWDATDSSSTSTPSWVKPEVMKAIKDFDPVHLKLKLSAQLKEFIENPRINQYEKYRKLMSPEEIQLVINKMIKGNEALNSKMFSILVPDLNKSQKMEFIENYTKGQVNVSDFKKMRPYLNNSQTLKVAENNPTILNNYEIASKNFNDHFSDEEKYNLVKRLDTKKINNTDSKVLLKKWSMTPEERAKHQGSSFYVYLATPETYIKSLTKVDPLNPESYRTINMMKLEKQLEGSNMYGIKTKAGELDEYIGQPYEKFPSNVIDMINDSSTKI